MATQDDINKDLYGKVNDLTKEFAQTNGYLKAIVGQNVELIGLLKKSLYTLACIAFICVLGSLFALIYGAIGKIENGTLTTQMGFLSVTNEMWQTAITENVDANRFAKDSRVRVTRMVPGSFAAEYNGEAAWLGVAGYGQKLVDSWLTDAQIRRIADLDFKELHRRGATFPGVSNEYWEQIQ